MDTLQSLLSSGTIQPTDNIKVTVTWSDFIETEKKTEFYLASHKEFKNLCEFVLFLDHHKLLFMDDDIHDEMVEEVNMFLDGELDFDYIDDTLFYDTLKTTYVNYSMEDNHRSVIELNFDCTLEKFRDMESDMCDIFGDLEVSEIHHKDDVYNFFA